MMKSDPLTTTEANMLETTRRMLDALESRLRSESFDTERMLDASDLGRLAGLADVAADALFNLLNTAQAFCGSRAAKNVIDKRWAEARVETEEEVV